MPGERGYAGWTVEIRGVQVHYGLFLAELVNFLIVAFALFVFTVKFLGWIRRLRTKEAEAPPPPPEEIRLLTEIRDLLTERPGPAAAPPGGPLGAPGL